MSVPLVPNGDLVATPESDVKNILTTFSWRSHLRRGCGIPGTSRFLCTSFGPFGRCCYSWVNGAPVYASSISGSLWLSRRFPTDGGSSIDFTTVSVEMLWTFKKLDSGADSKDQIFSALDRDKTICFGIGERKWSKINKGLSCWFWIITLTKWLRETLIFMKVNVDQWKLKWIKWRFKIFKRGVVWVPELADCLNVLIIVKTFSYTTNGEDRRAICKCCESFNWMRIDSFTEKRLICSFSKLLSWKKNQLLFRSSREDSVICLLGCSFFREYNYRGDRLLKESSRWDSWGLANCNRFNFFAFSYWSRELV